MTSTQTDRRALRRGFAALGATAALVAAALMTTPASQAFSESAHTHQDFVPAPPTWAEHDRTTTESGAPVVVRVLENDTYDDTPRRARVTVDRRTWTGGFEVRVNRDRTITVTAPAGFTGVGRGEYRIKDRNGTATAQVYVRVTDPGDPKPVARDDRATVVCGRLTHVWVLGNDTWTPGGTAIISLVRNTIPNGVWAYRSGATDLADRFGINVRCRLAGGAFRVTYRLWDVKTARRDTATIRVDVRRPH